MSYALDHSATVAQKVAALATADHSLAQARYNAFPPISGTLSNYASKSANYEGAFGFVGGKQQNEYSQNTAQLGTTYTLTTGGLAFLQLASARASDAQAREDLANTEDSIASAVAAAYYMVLQNQAIVTVDESDLHYQNVLVDVAKAKEHAGMVAGVDVLKAQVQQVKSASTLVGARADVDNSTEQLAHTIGAPLTQAFVFPKQIATPPLPQGDIDRLETIAINARPDLHSARESLLAAQYTRKGWNRELFPTVQISAAIGNQFAPTTAGEVIGVNPDGTPITVPRGSPGFWTLTAQSTFTLPFVDYGQRKTERESDDAQVASAQLNVDQTQTQVELDVRQNYRGAQTALAQMDYARDESRLGTESARIAQLQYQRGLITLADVIQTQQQSVVAQSDFVNARVAYVNSIVKLRVSLGIYDARSAVADLQ
ncbi:MAG: TolC family protein [Candidatus Eremiobacteraeota bacterium]|nr:TolC family protein [Candidatus Eremiobacteraeota bacterium]